MTDRQARRRAGNRENNRDRWLITYADLITLLLIFFVMMYAMSHLDTEKFDVVNESLQLTFKSGDSILEQGSGLTGTADNYKHKNPDVETNQSTTNTNQEPSGSEDSKDADEPKELTEREQAFRKQEQELQSLMSVISKYVSDNELGDQIFVADKPQGISITLSDRFVFDTGNADLKPSSEPALAKLASLFHNLNTTVSIEGHTDNKPIVYSPKYRDNWELSGARALSILRFFLDEEKLSPDGFQYAGYADTHPVGDNATELGRQTNRRVEIIVLRQLQEE
ncbi:OmpA/MotB family protein [Paenibacillus sp. IHBB 10380]|uniref:OmpA/MotB family protein n=1 Tax=Paenibacillus sp. IHBB 10380 TaxID=1566358 RepID=UPI0011862CE4|nr:flagellar motor protein MotB [Paenibacillus sp. IHBB 10380]